MQVDVDKIKEWDDKYVFEVLLDENDQKPPFEVTLIKKYYEKLTEGKVSPEVLVEASFRFLVEREPKEAIFQTFDISSIARYFPEYEKEIKQYFALQ